VMQPRFGILDVLERFPSCKPSLPEFLLLLAPRIAPRLYSIASSPGVAGDVVALCVGHVKEEPDTGRYFTGLASGCLARALTPGGPQKFDVYVRRSDFRLPQQPDVPVVMVGPGTGVAPFRGFCQEREAQLARGRALGPALLFTGFRSETEALCLSEFEAWRTSNVLTMLCTAISRPSGGAHGRHVQDDIWSNRVAVADALKAGGNFYICGDASRMARDVDKIMRKIVVDQGIVVDADAADQWLVAQRDAGKYRKDVYEQPDYMSSEEDLLLSSACDL